MRVAGTRGVAMAFVADFEVGGQEGCGEFVLDGVLHVLFFLGLNG